MKRCIFHYPGPLQDKAGVGSAVRPYQMMNAFRELGYEVDTVTGYSKERKKKIFEIKNKIKDGIKYDFVYSESVNSPIPYSDEDHLPRHPFMDFAFFRFCRKQRIPVGLFFRDVHWKFPIFKEAASFIKRMFLTPAFRSDVKHYKKCIDLLYLPTTRMQNYVFSGFPSSELPPGGQAHPDVLSYKQNREPVRDGILRVFYVGSLSSSLYDNKNLFKAVYETDNVHLTVCTHKAQWEKLRAEYEPYLCDRIEVVHKSGAELVEYYKKFDVSACCLKKCEYLDFAMPIKVFEAISYGTPLLVADIYSVSKFVVNENIGWNTKNNWQSIKDTLELLRDHPEEIVEKTNNVINAVPRHTWLARAEQVADELTKINK